MKTYKEECEIIERCIEEVKAMGPSLRRKYFAKKKKKNYIDAYNGTKRPKKS